MRSNSKLLDGSVRWLSVWLTVQVWALPAVPAAAQINAGANSGGAKTNGTAAREAVLQGLTTGGSVAKHPLSKVLLCSDPAAKEPASGQATATPVSPVNSVRLVKPVSFDDYRKTVKAIDYRKCEVSLSELKKLMGKKGVYILDLRSEREYKEGHIKGALHLGSDISEEKVAGLLPNKEATAIIYCNNNFYPTRMLSLNHGCLPQFVTLGYKNVKVLQDLWHDSFDTARDFMKGPLWVKDEGKASGH